MQFHNTLSFAQSLDAQDILKPYRDAFHFPKVEGKQVIYSNQNLHSSALTEVHAGKLLKIISVHEGWLRVLVKPDLQGWIPDNNLGKL